MKYLSVCSGIEAATVAWHPLGWTPVGFGEIEKFPCQVLAHHYPDVTNFGDMTKFKEWSIGSDVNVLVGGTPCQSFSVAGLRKGLDDPRGNLMLTYLAIAAKHRPKWLVWENVPGVLSSNGGLDFASLLRGMGELGYGFAYRVLDAQYFGVAQRRRRVFVVGYLGNWRPAAAVLFERHSLQGHPAPSREKGQGIAPTIKASVGTGGVDVEHPMVPVMHSCISPALKARDAKGPLSDGDGDGDGAILVPMMQPIALAENTIGRKPENGGNGDGFADGGPMYTLNATGVHGVAQPINIYGGNKRTDRPEGGFYVRMDEDISKTLDAASGLNPTCSQGGTAVMQPIPIDTMNHIGRGDKHSFGDFVSGAPSYTLTKHHSHAVAQPIPFDTTQITSPQNGNNPQAGDPCHPLAAGAHPPAICLMDQGGSAMTIENDMTGTLRRETHGHEPVVMQPIAFSRNDDGRDATHNLAPTMRVAGNAGGMLGIATSMAVRRLSPKECERLQGFPDGYTDIQPKGKATPDGPRYKALGNSMAVPVMRWIGERIAQVEAIHAP
ncbi:C-5 cytosine methyltransferase [uncultured Caudovirales phage]|uniref:Cytosine-specific methyltransferase n=1 Tax=uncultured Caudovirales phage TaxID=2100421 RepID=A0A6J5N6N1_9CAUD|nr:C-5 cytosine methyltransferase [uncultured Caudovirales phage]CAB4184150.1 C-5 cytosine methyltransferase [uncultured Caudovirales phage]CAB4202770.1 C-5 cytosine methyltransferase [uncultured Caudovirales phage]CAB4215377.1 C-5 cytosine methyltransferase [uncultured Caudovirales phage]CAB5230099.1 C-5 cytosine methyltransferase [uncultured Caudovirales phage]